jgi:hypothetical protein
MQGAGTGRTPLAPEAATAFNDIAGIALPDEGQGSGCSAELEDAFCGVGASGSDAMAITRCAGNPGEKEWRSVTRTMTTRHAL